MNTIDVATADLEPPPWQQRVVPLCREVLKTLGISNWELSVLLCADQTIQRLNRDYRKRDEPTDILSFSQLEAEPHPLPALPVIAAGDLVISLETTQRDCARMGIQMEEQVKRLLIHGILHLHGMDHDRDTGQMIALQEKLFGEIQGSLL